MGRSIVLIFMIGILLNMQKTKKIITLIFILHFTACGAVGDFFAKSTLLDMKPPPGPPEFQAAYIDACSTALNENPHSIIAVGRKRMYKHPVLNHRSNLYRTMWRDSYIYCALWISYLAEKHVGSFFRPSFSLQNRAMPGTMRKTLYEGAPPGPEKFRRGWKDGCNTGKGATGKSKHKLVYKFFKDARFIEGDGFNPEYDKGWSTAFWYCQRGYDVIESGGRGDFL